MPQSRHTKSLVDEQNLPKDLTVIASSPEAGPFILYSKKNITNFTLAVIQNMTLIRFIMNT